MPAAAATELAELVVQAFATYYRRYREVTCRARRRFVRREWRAAQDDAVERLHIYRDGVDRTVATVRAQLGGGGAPGLGAAIRGAYAERVARRAERELAETFYNSVIRRVFATVGVNPEVEFTGPVHAPTSADGPSVRCYAPAPGTMADTTALLRRVLKDTGFGALFHDLAGDAALAAARVDAELRRVGGAQVRALELLAPLFYRNKGAYLVGRIRHANGAMPLLLALLHPERGVVVDAVITTADDASIVFSFTRSYFQADIDHPGAVVHFLQGLMPRKRTDELYTAIGYHKHGKRELFQELVQQLELADACFARAEGERGMVMCVFTLPSFNVVFKVIRDRFASPKDTTRREVEACYQFVFTRDRVGRLADAQEFEHLELERRHFEPSLLEELRTECGRTVKLEAERVVIEHLYTERRVTPLNLFLRQAPAEQAREALLDYGAAIKDLAAANIFPGDMLLKNFGVTRHGRVVFYDYDELGLLTDYRFRRIPAPHDANEEMAAEPYFHAEPRDVFPEEFRAFLVPRGPLRDIFLRTHGDLFDVRFWRRMQQRQRAGEIVDVLPYRASLRLHPERDAAGD